MSHSRWKLARERKLTEGHTEPPEVEARRAEIKAAFDLGQLVYDRRTELGLSQAELAKRARMTQPQISSIEGGGVTPTIPILTRLAEALEAKLSITLEENHAASPPLRTQVTWRLKLTNHGDGSAQENADAMNAHLASVQEQLAALRECNPAIGSGHIEANLDTNKVTVQLTVYGDRDDAVSLSRTVIRTAIHAAGGFTPEWDEDRPATDSLAEYRPLGANLEYT
ncbi:helix-turn-helix domain-containing protein [Streptomyces sp. KLOTTS4A1]|uniref:helix-turn-helix domain-containing protein n=1 Tax=Streptomyces sp. KLOTTS4A1 TaxID=3390996 RepID=UPI0039F62990